MFESILSGILDAVQGFLDMVIGWLPKSPFSTVSEQLSLDDGLLGFIAWLVPFPEILAALQAWLLAIGLYYVYVVIARWIKLIGD
jgi:hypothetical protein